MIFTAASVLRWGGSGGAWGAMTPLRALYWPIASGLGHFLPISMVGFFSLFDMCMHLGGRDLMFVRLSTSRIVQTGTRRTI